MSPASGYARIAAERQTEARRRVATPTPCPKCGAPCLHGEDHDRAAIDALVDVESVTLVGEMVAALNGLPSYTVRPAIGKGYDAGAVCLVFRNSFTVAAGRDDHPIHVEHRCKEIE